MRILPDRNIAEKIFIALLCAVALVMPWHKVLPSPLLILAGGIAIIAGNPAIKWWRIRHNKSALIFSSVYLITLYSFFISGSREEASRDLQLKISIALMPLLTTAFIRFTKKEIILLLRCFVLSCIAFALFAVSKAAYDYFSSGATHFYYKELVEFSFMHPSYIAMYEVFSIVLLLFQLFNNWKVLNSVRRSIYIAIILFLILFVFLLTSKMAILSLIILIDCIFYLFIKPVLGRLKTIGILLLINIAGLLLILALPTTRERFTMLFRYNDVGYANSVDSREEIWKSANELAKEHLIPGIGSGDAEQELVDAYKKNEFQKGVDERYNAHNQYLQTLLEGGLFSLLLMIAVFLYSLATGWKAENFIYLSFLLIFIINILTESMLKTQSGVVFYSFFNTLLGLYFGRKREDLTQS